MSEAERELRKRIVLALVWVGTDLDRMLREEAVTDAVRRATRQALMVVKQDLHARVGDVALFDHGSLARVQAVTFLTAGMREQDVTEVHRRILIGPVED